MVEVINLKGCLVSPILLIDYSYTLRKLLQIPKLKQDIRLRYRASSKICTMEFTDKHFLLYQKYFQLAPSDKYYNYEKRFQYYFLSSGDGAKLEIMQAQEIPENMNDVILQCIFAFSQVRSR